MSDTLPGAANNAAAEIPATVLGEVEAWFKTHIIDKVSALWAQGKILQADVATYTAEHPAVVKIAEEALAEAPPAVQTAVSQGLVLAEKVAAMANDLDGHAASLGVPMAASKPAA
jgi:hypothetical protein